MVKKSIEKLYTDTCNIYEYQKVKNHVTKRTEFEPVLVHENVKCRISFKNITTTNQTTGEAITGQITVLFINPELVIKPNSKIDVTRNGRVLEYKNSGVPAFYSSHQEIVLELYKEQA
jgi:hypothetical protein